LTEAAPDGSGIQLQAQNGPIDDAMITGNSIVGPLSAGGGNTYFAAVRLDAKPVPFGGITVGLNSSRGAIRSVSCSQTIAGGFPQPIVSVGNRWNATPSCPIATFQTGQ
jgi:hypothetical protein